MVLCPNPKTSKPREVGVNFTMGSTTLRTHTKRKHPKTITSTIFVVCLASLKVVCIYTVRTVHICIYTYRYMCVCAPAHVFPWTYNNCTKLFRPHVSLSSLCLVVVRVCHVHRPYDQGCEQGQHWYRPLKSKQTWILYITKTLVTINNSQSGSFIIIHNDCSSVKPLLTII